MTKSLTHTVKVNRYSFVPNQMSSNQVWSIHYNHATITIKFSRLLGGTYIAHAVSDYSLNITAGYVGSNAHTAFATTIDRLDAAIAAHDKQYNRRGSNGEYGEFGAHHSADVVKALYPKEKAERTTKAPELDSYTCATPTVSTYNSTHGTVMSVYDSPRDRIKQCAQVTGSGYDNTYEIFRNQELSMGYTYKEICQHWQALQRRK